MSNAIETFDVRLRNEGFADGRLRCLYPDHRPVVGYAVTARIRCSAPPPVGHSYHDRTDWWNYIVSVPAPRIVVVQDVDERPGLGAFVGDVHAHILQALGCVAYATNGSVRDLDDVHDLGFQFFASGVAVSHAFAHIVDFGQPGGGGRAHGVDRRRAVRRRRRPAVAAAVDRRRHAGRRAEMPRAKKNRSSRSAGRPQFSIDGLRALVRTWDEKNVH